MEKFYLKVQKVIKNIMKNNKVLMLMSGGVDSSVAAQKIIEEGYEIVGVHFKTVDDIIFSLIPEKTKVCCSPSDTADAFKVAKNLGIKDFRVVDIKEDFKIKVIDYFINEYKSGRTPNPCIICNRFFKFGKALEIAEEIGADYVSSGHYVLNEYSKKYNCNVLRKGVDKYKDQSYFLSMIKKEYLKKLYFPLGKLTKDEIRKTAKDMEIIVADKPDSQELCFIPDNDYKRYLRDSGLENVEGKVFNLDGEHIGNHSGYTNYTIGQRAGINYFKSAGVKLHVLSINPIKNTIIVAPTEKLYTKYLKAYNLNTFVDFEEVSGSCRIRKSNEEKPALIRKSNDNEVEVFFQEDIFAVTPGQFAVFYDEAGFILGSGIIK